VSSRAIVVVLTFRVLTAAAYAADIGAPSTKAAMAAV
jgi:hypothetical protein